MSDLPNHARAVVIGCGIVGNSLAYHLCRLGWRDVLLLDKGPLPNPGGSTGHADRKSTRLNSSHSKQSRMPSSA